MLLLVGGICLTIGWYFSFRPSTLIVIALLLVIPGRIPALLWREFYTGQRALQLGDHERARASFIAFVEKVRARPWLKRLMYVEWGIHTEGYRSYVAQQHREYVCRERRAPTSRRVV
jgi:hypothetical protein